MEEGSAVTKGPGVMPVPESETERGVALALLVMPKVALSAPAAAGVNKMLAVQVAAAARLVTQVVDETEKSAALAPAIAAGSRLTEPEVLFVMLTDCEALLEPVLTVPKDNVAGETVTLPDGPTGSVGVGGDCGVLFEPHPDKRPAKRIAAMDALKWRVEP